MLRVAAFTSSRNSPSSRFRLRQFFDPLRSIGIDTVEFRPWISKYASAPWQLTGLGLLSRTIALLAARNFDLAWLNRELIGGYVTLERFAAKHRLLDVDDAIWLAGRKGFARRISRECDGVIAGNERIADYFSGAARRIWIIPTVVDPARFKPVRVQHESFTIGWSGTAWNLPYVYEIEKPLRRFLVDHPNAKILIVCDRHPRFQSLPAGRVEYERWTAETEAESLHRMDVGIMPLPDNEWTQAKCATKMLCCMASGLPVVVSPVGTAVSILARGELGLAARNADDWYEALAALYRDRALCVELGQCGRRVVEEHYSTHEITNRLAQIFIEVASA